uniref:Uncharacterized protein n=1 Tax=uncultured prokaryote TaxID=198431 RepID=A0A0H5QIU5_9ZZZZ|nr:hypothetical protein [uncultured prokaryote]
MKKCLCVILTLVMCTALCIPAFAASPDEISSQAITDEFFADPDFSNMSIGELNAFIHSIMIQTTDNNAAASRVAIISQAWIAAAEIASKVGYPCAGAVVKSSARVEDYIESNGLLANTIQTTNAFASWKRDLGNYIVFEKSDNSDLFYAIHKANISVTGNSSGARAWITDIFNFEFDTDMGDLFATFVNDWGWLSQNIGALSEINVQVDIRL